ncbi:tyrosine-protein kinase Etk/Wzc [Orbus hercynius]|uniref:Tyrosine-protein kinase Etk/Wzc n=1 Tax=Orbus hercynius TaxID=593135 RepID=A0A495RH64_9GAMM|nr:polysaccharide biosynthesis tyrosine autokinase [Orbus hercynius]RKS86832.1 tyrosine-protein kinase Etk/Wzc [Orbus hercynius]
MVIKEKKNVAKETDEIDLVGLFYALLDKWKIIVVFTCITTILGMMYAFFATPVYNADALIQVEQKSASGLLNDFTSAITGTKPMSTAEIELIRSRMIIGKTVKDLALDVEVNESFFPIFGRGFARLTGQHHNEIALSRYDVPRRWYDQPLELKIVDDNHYILTKDGSEILSGTVGEYSSNNGISILVSQIDAAKGTVFLITKRSQIDVINSILNNLSIADKGKDTGILQLNLQGEDPLLVQNILDQITKNYLAQNVERGSAEAGKSLEFLKSQLPRIKAELEDSENKLNKFRQQNDSVDLSLEAKSVLDTSVQLEAQLNELTFKEAEVSKLYTKEHPAYRSLLEKRQVLLDERDRLGGKITFLPQTQQEILRLTRDVKANNEVYMQLLNKQQELSISQASTVGNVRIIDQALVQIKPIKPKKILIISISFLLGLILSSGIIILFIALRRTIETVQQLEDIGLNVYASVPLSDWQRQQNKNLKQRLSAKQQKNVRAKQLVSIGAPNDLSVEALRSLRTSLHFAMLEAKNNILSISGCSPEIGKTFISTNLAVVIADLGKKVLLIDSDMRKGYLHEMMNLQMKQGLSEYLSGQQEIDSIICTTPLHDNLDFIARGMVPPNPSELLMHPRLNDLLDWASKEYDIVLIDTPPVLAVTDACIVSQYAGTVMLVVGYGKNTVKEIELGRQRFEQNNINIKGVIFNGVVRKKGSYYQYGYSYK